MRIPIFLSADDAYAPFAATTIASICDNTSSAIDFYVMDSGISRKNRENIASLREDFDNFTVEFLPVDVRTVFREFREIGHFSLSTYCRFLVPNLKPHVNKAIYLDVDVIALSDIRELYEQDMRGHALAAVCEEQLLPGGSNADEGQRIYAALRLAATHNYFNAGVLLMELETFRRDRIAERCFALETRFRQKLRNPDQDILNKLFGNKVHLLDRKFNYTNHLSAEARYFVPDVVIRHFNTDIKPWNSAVYKDSALQYFNEFWYYASLTPFFGDLRRTFGEVMTKNAVKQAFVNPKELFNNIFLPSARTLRQLRGRHTKRRTEVV
jgi:lipopolysaccharide biosynthesis glycosyltransferase